MTRTLLKVLNAPLLLLLAIVGIAIQSSLFSSWPLLYFQPDVVLIIVVWCGLRRNFVEGGLITLMAGEMSEIHSAAPQGLYLITDMLVYLSVRGAARFLVIPNLFSYAVVTWVASISMKLLGLFILYLLGSTSNAWRYIFTNLLLGAAIESFFSTWMFKWLERLDWTTYKNVRADRIMEDELHLESEGF